MLLAALISPVLRRSTLPKAERVAPWVAVVGAPLIAFHLIGVPFLPSRARGTLVFRSFLDRADAGVPDDPSIAQRTLVYVNPPHLPYASYLAIERAGQERPRPRFIHTLATATTEVTFTRLDLFSVRLQPRGGFLQNPSSRLSHSDERRFQVGQRIQQGDMQVVIRQITPDGRPLEVDMHFPRALEDPLYLWRQWVGTTTVTFDPPAMGETIVLPSADYGEVTFGFAFPISLRL